VTAPAYLEHLTDGDLRLLRGRALEDPQLFEAVFRDGGDQAFLHASPFLVFATLVARVARDLDDMRFYEEWVGVGQRVPVFDVTSLRTFSSESTRRLFLAELLASYTHVSSGSVLFRTTRGWRRRRYSELDPVRLIELSELVPAADRPGVFRRLGDLALFLSGVFPDYAGGQLLTPVARRRLSHSLTDAKDSRSGGRPDQESDGALVLLEAVGRRAYLTAWRASGGRGTSGVLGEVTGTGFGVARRVLNVLTDRYLFPLRDRWFSSAA
jgi:hypothetical protein